MKYVLGAIAVLAGVSVSVAAGQEPNAAVRWMRDSDEYAALVLQTYRSAERALRRQVEHLPAGTRWAVVLDVDETAVDNSVYQLELGAYDLPYDTASWNHWVRRERAEALPGAVAFVQAVRSLGGRVAFVTNRSEWVRGATERNLDAVGLLQAGDRACLAVPEEPRYTKRARRAEIRAGTGRCGWPGEPVRVLVYLGDDLNDFPTSDEEAGEFGEQFFVLPNPSYGSWVNRRRTPP